MTEVNRSQPKLTCDPGDEDVSCRQPPTTEKKTDPPATKEKLFSSAYDEPISCSCEDRAKTPSGVSYSEMAKKMKAAEDPGPVFTAGVTNKGTVGASVTLSQPDRDTKYGSASVKVGLQNEVNVTGGSKEATIGRVGSTTFKVSADAAHGHVGIGVHNPDGSTGVNAGAGAAIGSVGVSMESDDGTSFGLSAEAGESGGASFGFKTDEHGKAVACAQVNIGPVQVSFCTPTSLPGNTRP